MGMRCLCRKANSVIQNLQLLQVLLITDFVSLLFSLLGCKDTKKVPNLQKCCVISFIIIIIEFSEMHNIKSGPLGVTALFFTFNHLIFATCDTLANNRAASISLYPWVSVETGLLQQRKLHQYSHRYGHEDDILALRNCQGCP